VLIKWLHVKCLFSWHFRFQDCKIEPCFPKDYDTCVFLKWWETCYLHALRGWKFEVLITTNVRKSYRIKWCLNLKTKIKKILVGEICGNNHLGYLWKLAKNERACGRTILGHWTSPAQDKLSWKEFCISGWITRNFLSPLRIIMFHCLSTWIYSLLRRTEEKQ